MNTTITSIFSEIVDTLSQDADPAEREGRAQFFKESIQSHGVRVPRVHTIAREAARNVGTSGKEGAFQLCELLWNTGMFEECLVACDISYAKRKWYEVADMDVFESWIDSYVDNWAVCDSFCTHAVADILVRYPHLIPRLDNFCRSHNRWKRRAAAVSLINPARHGLFLAEVFTIADLLLVDQDDLVQKGYGWMLKSAADSHQMEVYQFVLDRKSSMPRTALRYAVEKMTPELRARAMS